MVDASEPGPPSGEFGRSISKKWVEEGRTPTGMEASTLIGAVYRGRSMRKGGPPLPLHCYGAKGGDPTLPFPRRW